MNGSDNPGYRVVLVVPPFRTVVRPALGVSLLQSVLQQQGFGCRTQYANLWLADRMGVQLYEFLAEPILLSPGEFLFSCVRFKRPLQDIERYVDEVLLAPGSGPYFRRLSDKAGLVRLLADLVELVAEFVDDAADRILHLSPRLVGLTSSYQENLGCLALAHRLKAKSPGVITVMGGANCGGEMGEELIRQFPEIDYVGQGECDCSFVELVSALAAGDTTRPVAGMLARGGESPGTGDVTISAEEFERTPFPEFGDYFEQVRALGWRRRFLPGLIMESSRGCWWGARHRCSFCGLNGEQLAFRSKSAARFQAEMAALSTRYGIRRIEMVDNIVDPRYFREVFPALAALPRVEQFWETPGSMTRRQVDALADGGATHIQAGIESLSGKSLQLMKKPTTPLRNIQTLKWCKERGIRVLWSHLFGVPGESEDEVGQLSLIAEAIHHLDPPGNAHLIRLQRFSPYFEDSDRYGFGEVRPATFYRHLYPFGEESVSRLAFHFDSEFSTRKAGSVAFARMRAVASRWKRAHWRSHLVEVNTKRGLLIIDTRPCARRLLTTLTGHERRVYEVCDKARDVPGISSDLKGELTVEEIEAALRSLMDRLLVLGLDGQYLALGTRAPDGRHGRMAARMPGGHLRSLSIADLVAAWRRRAGVGLLTSAYLRRELPRAVTRSGARLAASLLSGLIGTAARFLSTPGDRVPLLEPELGLGTEPFTK